MKLHRLSVLYRFSLTAVLLLGTLFMPLFPVPVVSAGVTSTIVYVCDESHLRTALAGGGGTINFWCSGTITLTSTSGYITISTNTLLDGAGQTVVISGGNGVRIFYVNNGVTFTVQNLTLRNGHGDSHPDSEVQYRGGAIYNYGGTVNVNNTIFSNNSAAYGGGAIFNRGGTLTVTDSTFNSNTSSLGLGAGIATSGGTSTVNSSTFQSNSAQNGGALSINFGDVYVTNSTFHGNSATGSGGAIANLDDTLLVTNSTFANNSAPTGGTLYNGTGPITIRNSILLKGASGGNCNGAMSGTANLSDDNTCGANFTTSAAITTNILDYYGGTTKTMALVANSAAIDTANPTYCPATDQRGQTRSDLGCDVGAFELKYGDSSNVQRAASSASVTTFGPTLVGVQRDAAYSDPGTISATKTANWDGQGMKAIRARWEITPTVSTNIRVTLKLCYTDAESNALALADLRLWRYQSGGWSQVGGTPTTSRDGSGNNCAWVSGVDFLGTWTLATEQPFRRYLPAMSR